MGCVMPISHFNFDPIFITSFFVLSIKSLSFGLSTYHIEISSSHSYWQPWIWVVVLMPLLLFSCVLLHCPSSPFLDARRLFLRIFGSRGPIAMSGNSMVAEEFNLFSTNFLVNHKCAFIYIYCNSKQVIFVLNLNFIKKILMCL